MQQAKVTTVAGTGEIGATDGPLAQAQLMDPFHIAFSQRDGGIVFTQTTDCLVRNISVKDCVIRRLAGSGAPGFLDGVGQLASFNFGSAGGGVAVDKRGSVYVADHMNHCIRRIAPDSNAVTVAAGTPGNLKASCLRFPVGLAFDKDGNLYFTEKSNSVHMLDPAGNVHRVCGNRTPNGSFKNGSKDSAEFNNPCGLDIDDNGNVFVADRGNHVIRKISLDGVASVYGGLPGKAGHVDGLSSVSIFNEPSDVKFDGAGNLYVCDTGNCCVRVISADGVVSTVAGASRQSAFVDNCSGADARFVSPTGLVVDAFGVIYVADYGANRIRRIENVAAHRGFVTPAKIRITVSRGRSLAPKDPNGKSDPYVKIKYGETKDKTKIVYKDLNPTWNQHFDFPFVENQSIDLETWDYDRHNADDFMGLCGLTPDDIMKVGMRWITLKNKPNSKSKVSGDLLIGIQHFS